MLSSMPPCGRPLSCDLTTGVFLLDFDFESELSSLDFEELVLLLYGSAAKKKNGDLVMC